MKRIKYKYVYAEINHGTEEQPDIEEAFVIKHIPYSEENLAIAQAEAYNGEVTVEEVEDEEREPTTEERISALEESKANQTEVDELNEALELILSGVTE